MAVTETPGPSKPTGATTANASAEESSGLLDIRDMAQSTKRRVTQRIATETDAQEALLAARPSALRDVVLPVATTATEPRPLALGTQAEVPSIQEVGDVAPSRTPWLVAAGVGALLLVGGGAALLLRGPDAAGAAAPAAEQAAPAEPGGLIPDDGDDEAEADAPTPTTEPMVVAEGLAEGEPADADAVEGEATDEVIADAEAGKDEGQADADAEPATAALVAEPAAKPAAPARKAPVARARPAGKKKAAATPPAQKPAARAAAGGGAEPDLDALLDQAAGPVDKVAARREVAATPTKKRLTRGDINSTLRKQGPAAQACADKHGAEGMMQVRLRIEPSGKVASATPQGKFKGSSVGSCVATAVQKAQFPAYAGAPMTVTFPFLLQ